jgi:hypothetical protein
MPKVLNTYGGFTATQINARASDTCTHSVVGTTVECIDVNMSKVNTLLGAATYSLKDLCEHASVNKWSGFGPREWLVVAGDPYYTVEDGPRYPYSLGSFAGYNHSAVAPIAPASSFIYTRTGGSRTVQVALRCKVGEYNWGELGATHCKAYVYDSGSLYAESDIMPLDTGGDWIVFDEVEFTFSTTTIYTKTYDTYIVICQSDGNELALIPVVGAITVEVVAPVLNTLVAVISGNNQTFQMLSTVSYVGNTMYRTGQYTGNGNPDGKILDSIVYTVYNAITDDVIDTETVTSFNANEYPTVLDVYNVNDTETFYADFDTGSGRPHPYLDEYMRVQMYYT